MQVFPVVTAGDESLQYIFPSKQRAAQAAIDLAAKDPLIRRLCVFGSAVTMDCGMTSDLDLAIDAPSVSEEGFLKLCRPFFREIESEVDVVHYNRIRNASLKKEIDEKGVCIYVKRQ